SPRSIENLPLCHDTETDGGESVRLVGGRSGREGRVEVYYEGAWGSVCRGSLWGTREAKTVCKELGLFENGAIAVSGYQFGSARYGYTQVNGVQCFGNESHLITCPGGGCTEGSIRLAGGQTPRQGRVEVCHGGIWGTVCKEGGSEWLDTDADRVCREVGFQEQDETGDLFKL
ncbi:Scavenger receptor cysteine-rich domain superfamily protein, partial [Geodia barretti]